MIDDKFRELKELSNHDVEEEKKLLSLSSYDYWFHIESLTLSSKKKNESIQKATPGNRKGKFV